MSPRRVRRGTEQEPALIEERSGSSTRSSDGRIRDDMHGQRAEPAVGRVRGGGRATSTRSATGCHRVDAAPSTASTGGHERRHVGAVATSAPATRHAASRAPSRLVANVAASITRICSSQCSRVRTQRTRKSREHEEDVERPVGLAEQQAPVELRDHRREREKEPDQRGRTSGRRSAAEAQRKPTSSSHD